jgi:hypothetical protein
MASAVQALSVLLLRAAAEGAASLTTGLPLLEGDRGSLASSLDAAIYKQVAWLDVFGFTPKGNPVSRRVFLRCNPGRRRPGPVMVDLNTHVIPKNAVFVYMDSHPLQSPADLEKCAASIEAAWIAEHSRLADVSRRQPATVPEMR